MVERNFGQFVRVLVDMDVTRDLRYKILVERGGFKFLVELAYENLANFCTHCKKIGHYVDICKNLNKDKARETEEAPTKNYIEPIMEFRQLKYGRKEQGSHPDDPILIEKVNGVGNKNKSPITIYNVGKTTASCFKEGKSLVEE